MKTVVSLSLTTNIYKPVIIMMFGSSPYFWLARSPTVQA